MTRHAGNARVANIVSAARCAREGLKIASTGKISAGEACSLASLYSTAGSDFYERAMDNLHEIVNEIDHDRNTDVIMRLINVSGLLLDRMTKYELMMAPGLETDANYTRTAEGIEKKNETVPYHKEKN